MTTKTKLHEKKLPILVLMGGVSREREISLISGEAIYKALIQKNYNAKKYIVDDEALEGITPETCALAFIALHGRFGEDGQAQQILEERGVPYTGSDPSASKNAMDKTLTKELFKKNGVPTPPYQVLKEAADAQNAIKSLGLPLFIKPADEGSSIGISKVLSAGEVAPAVECALQYSNFAIAETLITGREMTCGILSDTPLPIIELKPKRDFYDYEAKYSSQSGTEYSFETGLTQEETSSLQEIAIRAHKSLGCKSVSRVDFMLSETGAAFVLEVNTIPGMTEHSLLPKAAQQAGLDFPSLCEKIALMAIECV